MAASPIPENALRTLALALAAWAAGVILGAASGVFERLPWPVDATLAAFCVACALATYALDAAVREQVHRAPRALLAWGAVGADAAIALMVQDAARTGPQALDALWRFPLALLPFFALPLAVVVTVAAARALAGARITSPAARSPGASRAAT